jgi:hypothetical protein
MIVAPSYIAFQWRAKAGGNVTQTALTTPFAARYVKVTRVGSAFSGYYSSDGVTWTQLGTSQTIAMATNATAGLAVTSQSTTKTSTATFTNVSLSSALNINLNQVKTA